MKLGLSILLSVRPSFLLSGWAFSWNCISCFFKFWHGARNLYEVVHDRAGFSGKNFFCPQNWENGPKMCQKQGFEFIDKFGH